MCLVWEKFSRNIWEYPWVMLFGELSHTHLSWGLVQCFLCTQQLLSKYAWKGLVLGCQVRNQIHFQLGKAHLNCHNQWVLQNGCCSVAQLCLTLCDPVNCSMPGGPVLHHLPACSSSCPLSRWCHPTIPPGCPLLLLPSIFPSIRVFLNELALRIKVARVLELQHQHQSFQWILGVDFL